METNTDMKQRLTEVTQQYHLTNQELLVLQKTSSSSSSSAAAKSTGKNAMKQSSEDEDEENEGKVASYITDELKILELTSQLKDLTKAHNKLTLDHNKLFSDYENLKSTLLLKQRSYDDVKKEKEAMSQMLLKTNAELNEIRLNEVKHSTSEKIHKLDSDEQYELLKGQLSLLEEEITMKTFEVTQEKEKNVSMTMILQKVLEKEETNDQLILELKRRNEELSTQLIMGRSMSTDDEEEEGEEGRREGDGGASFLLRRDSTLEREEQAAEAETERLERERIEKEKIFTEEAEKRKRIQQAFEEERERMNHKQSELQEILQKQELLISQLKIELFNCKGKDHQLMSLITSYLLGKKEMVKEGEETNGLINELTMLETFVNDKLKLFSSRIDHCAINVALIPVELLASSGVSASFPPLPSLATSEIVPPLPTFLHDPLPHPDSHSIGSFVDHRVAVEEEKKSSSFFASAAFVNDHSEGINHLNDSGDQGNWETNHYKELLKTAMNENQELRLKHLSLENRFSLLSASLDTRGGGGDRTSDLHSIGTGISENTDAAAKTITSLKAQLHQSEKRLEELSVNYAKNFAQNSKIFAFFESEVYRLKSLCDYLKGLNNKMNHDLKHAMIMDTKNRSLEYKVKLLTGNEKKLVGKLQELDNSLKGKNEEFLLLLKQHQQSDLIKTNGLEKELDEMKSKYHSLEITSNQYLLLTKDLQKKLTDVSFSSEKEKKLLQNKYDLNNNEILIFQRQLHEKDYEIKGLKDALSELRQSISSLELTNSMLQQEVSSSSESSFRKISDYKNEIIEKNKMIEELSKEVTLSKTRLMDIESSILIKNEENSQMLLKTTEKDDKIHLLMKTIDQQTKQLSQLSEMNNKLKEEMKEKNHYLMEVKESLEKLNRNYENELTSKYEIENNLR
jgi:hypothetical protein